MIRRTFENKLKPFSNFYCLFTIQPLMMHSSKTPVAPADLGNDEELMSLAHVVELLFERI